MAVTKSSTGVLVGGKILIRMDGKVIGFANEATCSDSYGLQPIHVLGQLQPLDYVPTEARHQIDMNLMIVKGSSLITANLEPAGAGNFGFLDSSAIGGGTSLVSGKNLPGGPNAGVSDTKIDTIVAPSADSGALRVLHGKVFDIDIITPAGRTSASTLAGAAANDTNGIVIRYKHCFFNSGSVRFNANQITVHSCSFFALDKEGAYVADSETSAPLAWLSKGTY